MQEATKSTFRSAVDLAVASLEEPDAELRLEMVQAFKDGSQLFSGRPKAHWAFRPLAEELSDDKAKRIKEILAQLAGLIEAQTVGPAASHTVEDAEQLVIELRHQLE